MLDLEAWKAMNCSMVPPAANTTDAASRLLGILKQLRNNTQQAAAGKIQQVSISNSSTTPRVLERKLIIGSHIKGQGRARGAGKERTGRRVAAAPAEAAAAPNIAQQAATPLQQPSDANSTAAAAAQPAVVNVTTGKIPTAVWQTKGVEWSEREAGVFSCQNAAPPSTGPRVAVFPLEMFGRPGARIEAAYNLFASMREQLREGWDGKS